MSLKQRLAGRWCHLGSSGRKIQTWADNLKGFGNEGCGVFDGGRHKQSRACFGLRYDSELLNLSPRNRYLLKEDVSAGPTLGTGGRAASRTCSSWKEGFLGRIAGRQGGGQCQWRGSLCVLLAVAAPLRSGGHTPGSLDDSFVWAWRAAMSQACRLSWQLRPETNSQKTRWRTKTAKK